MRYTNKKDKNVIQSLILILILCCIVLLFIPIENSYFYTLTSTIITGLIPTLILLSVTYRINKLESIDNISEEINNYRDKYKEFKIDIEVLGTMIEKELIFLEKCITYDKKNQKYVLNKWTENNTKFQKAFTEIETNTSEEMGLINKQFYNMGVLDVEQRLVKYHEDSINYCYRSCVNLINYLNEYSKVSENMEVETKNIYNKIALFRGEEDKELINYFNFLVDYLSRRAKYIKTYKTEIIENIELYSDFNFDLEMYNQIQSGIEHEISADIDVDVYLHYIYYNEDRSFPKWVYTGSINSLFYLDSLIDIFLENRKGINKRIILEDRIYLTYTKKLRSEKEEIKEETEDFDISLILEAFYNQ